MSISLVGYSEDSSSSSEDSEEEVEKETKPQESTNPKVALPSAADLLDAVNPASFMSLATSVGASPPLTVPKRKHGAAGSQNGSDESNKRGKTGEKSEPSRSFVPPQMSRPNVVTEDAALWSSDATLRRQRQAASSKARDDDGAKGKESANFKQREKDVDETIKRAINKFRLSKSLVPFVSRRGIERDATRATVEQAWARIYSNGQEKDSPQSEAKRDKGQASREKSYVEEEKRLLRELESTS